MVAQDGLGSLIAYLQAQVSISNLLGLDVYGTELPKDQVSSMAKKAIVLTYAGGVRAADYSDINSMRLDFFCYGDTPLQARVVWRTLAPILQNLERTLINETLIYSASHSAGPFPSRSSQVEWPLLIDTWLITMNETLCV